MKWTAPARWLPVGFILGGALLGGCGREVIVVPVANELGMLWEGMPHRISEAELTLVPNDSGDGGQLIAQNDGGSMGLFDHPLVRYGLTAYESSHLAVKWGSAELIIPPGGSAEGEPFSATQEVSLPAGRLKDADALVAWVRGLAISTNQYEEPPDFVASVPYDPHDGYTSQGIGVRLGTPTVSGSRVVLTVVGRNSLGLADRADMNAAIPLATTWMRVDFGVVGVVDQKGRMVTAEVAYTLGWPTYGHQTVHEHADAEQQGFTVDGRSGLASALFGISAFDVWANISDHHDPGCVVVQDERNFWGEPVSGPGRYIREISVRLGDVSYDRAHGVGTGRLDIFFSNSSVLTEIGNLCLGLRGEVAMLQVDDDELKHRTVEPFDPRFDSGEFFSEAVSF